MMGRPGVVDWYPRIRRRARVRRFLLTAGYVTGGFFLAVAVGVVW